MFSEAGASFSLSAPPVSIPTAGLLLQCLHHPLRALRMRMPVARHPPPAGRRIEWRGVLDGQEGMPEGIGDGAECAGGAGDEDAAEGAG